MSYDMVQFAEGDIVSVLVITPIIVQYIFIGVILNDKLYPHISSSQCMSTKK